MSMGYCMHIMRIIEAPWLTACLPGFLGHKIRWNFTKFLIGRDGQPIKRFAPGKAPQGMESFIQKALKR